MRAVGRGTTAEIPRLYVPLGPNSLGSNDVHSEEEDEEDEDMLLFFLLFLWYKERERKGFEK